LPERQPIAVGQPNLKFALLPGLVERWLDIGGRKKREARKELGVERVDVWNVDVDRHSRLPIEAEAPPSFFENPEARAAELEVGVVALAIQHLERQSTREELKGPFQIRNMEEWSDLMNRRRPGHGCSIETSGCSAL
jgi:hypothetical protein